MKTDYTQDLRNLLTTMFTPSTPEEDGSVAFTLQYLHGEVTNILPIKWVDEADVYDMLTELGFKPFQEKTETTVIENNKKKTLMFYSLKYFLKRNQ